MSDAPEPLEPALKALIAATRKPVAPPGVQGALWWSLSRQLAVPAGLALSKGLLGALGMAVFGFGVATGVALERTLEKAPPPPRVEMVAPAPVVVPLVTTPVAPPPQALLPSPPPPLKKEAALTAAELAEQRQMLETARQALVRRDAEAALATLRQVERRWPQGALSEEREAMAIQALMMAGRKAEAVAALTRFTRKYPDSIFTPEQ